MNQRRPGQPTKYDPDYCERLILFMKRGFSFEAFAGEIGVCTDTIYEWAKVHPEFSEAKKKAYAQSRRWWEEQGINGLYDQYILADDGSKANVKFNTVNFIFQMKNRFRKEWTESKTVELNTTDKTADEVNKAKAVEELKDWLKTVVSDKRGV